MTKTDFIIRSALAGVLALGVSSAAFADNTHENEEKCAGVIKAGMNDCATSMNECHGHVSVDSHPEAWIYVPKGTCEKIVGAAITTQRDPTPGVEN